MHHSILKSLAASLAALSISAAARSTDPVPPPGGWAIQSALDLPIQWSDSYRSRIDVYWPDVPAAQVPSTGWPAVLVVHGGGRSRKVGWAQTTMQKLAATGYVAFGYDVRGDGVTPTLNPTWGQNKGTHARRLQDVAECFRRMETARPQLVDESRLGVYGQSQGGGHAYRSAA